MRKYLDPVLLTGVFTSILIAVALYLLGVETFQSTLVALLGTIITLQIDQIGRTESAIEKTRQYATSWQKLETSSWLKEYIEQIIEASYVVGTSLRSDIFVESAKLEVESCRNNLQEMARGQLRTPDHRLMLRATERAKERLRAISVSNPVEGFGWWTSPIGRRYWEANLEMLAKGVRIERIFVYDQLTDKLQDLVREQATAGVEVFTCSSARLSNDLRVNSILFDESFVYELRVSADGKPLEHLCSVNASDISRKLRNYEAVKLLADKQDVAKQDAT